VAVSEALEWAHADSSVVYISVVDNNKQKIALLNITGQVLDDEVILKGDSTRQINEIIYYGTPIVYQNASFGRLIIGYSLTHVYEMIGRLKRTTLYFCLVLFAVGVILSIILSKMITGNIRKLDYAVKAIANGDENVQVEVKSNDEIGKLSRAFNNMLQRIDKSRTELVKYSEQLKKQNEELSQFSYVVSHDLKAPLRAIFKLSEWIEDDLGTNIPEESKKNMQILRSRVSRLEGLINGLLQYSKIGRVNVPIERLDVQRMLDETIDLLNPPDHIKISIQAGMPVFKTKKYMLQQVFINLISNAIKYNDKAEGVVGIAVTDIGKFYRFEVADNGMGINKDYHEKVFEIFQTLEARDKVEATGVGLALIKKSVEDMGGIVELESEEDKGSKFSFTWPKAA
jgi:signal transduction histidine kinase